MMKRMGLLRIALAGCFLALAAPAAQAAQPTAPDGRGVEVRVINNNAAVMRVYVEDAKGSWHHLGRVARSDFKILEVPDEIVAMGGVQIRLIPSEPVWSFQGEPDGVRTRYLYIATGDALNVWVENDLLDTYVEIIRG
jgi:hypothetical protein